MTSRQDPDARVTGRTVHPIEAESYAILRSRIDLSDLPPLVRAVTERVVHASADLDYAAGLVCDENALRRGWRALREGAPIVADVAMVASGITARRAAGEVICRVGDPAAAERARTEGITRSAAAVRLAAAEVGPGAVWVIGCAPTALYAVIAADVDPALVVGLPVGFVGAAESKAALRASGLPAVSNRGEKGGSAVAAAAVNALLYTDTTTEPPPAHRSAHASAATGALEETGRNT
jgi:precorrin-8X/cobalt-precorrin-8 methylmutase